MEPFHGIDPVYSTRDHPREGCRLLNPISLIGIDSWLYILERLPLRDDATFNFECGGAESMSPRMIELEPIHVKGQDPFIPLRVACRDEPSSFG